MSIASAIYRLASTTMLWLAICATVLYTAAAADDGADARYLDGLRQRRLFDLAEAWCRRELADSPLAEERRVQMTLELSRTLTEHALHSTQPQRGERFEQAAEVADRLAGNLAESRYRVLLDVQSALVHLTRGELLRQEDELLAGQQQQAAARDELREAVSRLRAAAERVEPQLRERNLAGSSAGDGPDADALQSLQKNIDYQLARAYRNQGQTYEPESADHVSAISQAVELLKPLAELDAVDPLAWRSRVDLVVCARLLADGDSVSRLIAQFQEQSPPADAAAQLQAEHLRLLIARGDLPAALEHAATLEQAREADAPELDLAILETYLAAANDQAEPHGEAVASDAARNKHQASAARVVATMEERYGAYWSRRAETLLAGSVAQAGGTQEIDVLLRAAAGFYRGGHLQQALATYDRAAQQAATADNAELRFEALMTAAAIAYEARQMADAEQRFSELARALPEQPRAAEAHLAAVRLAAQQVRGGDSAAVDRYTRLLEEHLRLWPRTPSASQAAWWLASIRYRQGDHAAAIAALEQMQPESPHHVEAIELLGECFEQQISASATPATAAAEAAAHFERLTLDEQGELPAEWNAAQRQAALWACRIWLANTTDRYDRVERIVQAAMQGSGAAAEPEWMSAAQGLLAAALAGQARLDEAATALADSTSDSLAQRLALVEQLAAIEPNTPSAAAALASLQLMAAEPLAARREAMPPDERRRFDLIYAAALVKADRREEAAGVLEALSRAQSDVAETQEAYAQFLLDAPDKPTWQKALDMWRTVEQRSQSGTPRWFRAKYALALLHQRLGNSQRSIEIIELTRILHPTLGGPELQAQFLALLKEVKR